MDLGALCDTIGRGDRTVDDIAAARRRARAADGVPGLADALQRGRIGVAQAAASNTAASSPDAAASTTTVDDPSRDVIEIARQTRRARARLRALRRAS